MWYKPIPPKPGDILCHTISSYYKLFGKNLWEYPPTHSATKHPLKNYKLIHKAKLFMDKIEVIHYGVIYYLFCQKRKIMDLCIYGYELKF